MPLAHAPPPASSLRHPPRRFVASLVLGSGSGLRVAPSRVRLWNPGINPWDGSPPINLTRAAAERVIAEFTRRGNPLSMDFDHAQSLAERAAALAPIPTAPEQTPGAGYCALELVETLEGPAIDFLPAWSFCGREAPVPEVVCCARHQIESGQRCEFSPDWLGDPETGEPIKVNRISLVGDGAMHGRGLLASRAAVEAGMDPMKECRAAYAYHARMAAAGGDDAKDHETMAGKLKASAAALGIDLDKAEPDGDEPKPAAPPGEAKPKEAAETIPVPKGPEDQLPKPAMGAAPFPALASQAAQPLTLAAVLAHLDARDKDRGALVALLDANKDRLNEKQVAYFASRGLAEARAFIETLAARPIPDKGTQGDTGGPPGGKMRPWKAPLDAAGQYLASKIRVALGKTEAQEVEFDKRIDEDGGITVSMVELVEERRAARLKGRAAA